MNSGGFGGGGGGGANSGGGGGGSFNNVTGKRSEDYYQAADLSITSAGRGVRGYDNNLIMEFY
jgi:hypothetical protein